MFEAVKKVGNGKCFDDNSGDERLCDSECDPERIVRHLAESLRCVGLVEAGPTDAG